MRHSGQVTAPKSVGSALHTHVSGDPHGTPILAIHGVSGHGARWQVLAERVPSARWIAPDLRGHGRSPWTPPWNLETQVADLIAVLEAHADRPALIVGHSFGGALALQLAAAAPQRCAGLVLLDPAVAVDPARALRIAEASLRQVDFPDAAAARADKLAGAWGPVEAELLDAEVAEHLETGEDGRVRWRYSTAALIADWGEMARPFALPPTGLPTTVVPARRTQPPYASPALHAALADRLSDALRVVPADTDHMVAQEAPDFVAALIEAALAAVESTR